jgi:NAD-dependent DNA ligase
MFGLEEQPISEIISLLELADELYYNDEESFLSDTEYDVIYRYAKNTEPTNTLFLGVGSMVRGGKTTLPFQMGSLDQIYEGEIQQWVKKWNLQSNKGVVSDKLDGASAMVVYDSSGKFQIGYSRGDGLQGADLSRHLTQMSSVPKSIMTSGKPFVVRGENIISLENFPKIQEVVKTSGGKQYKNPRNCVSGLMNASSNPLQAYKYIDFIAYEIVGSELSKKEQLHLLADLGFLVVSWEDWRFDSMDDGTLTTHLINRKLNSPWELDGIVIDVNDAVKRASMNPTRSSLNPAIAVKYKVADASNYAEVVVTDVTFSISKHGYLKPTIQLVPTDLVGVTISNCTGFNAKFIKDNKIGPGAIIGLVRSGMVIPFCTTVIKPMLVENYDDWFDAKIKEFGDTHWTATGIDLVLDDADTDVTAKYGRLVDFFNTIDAPFLAEGHLQKIFDMGFETPESVIMLTQEDLSSLLNSKIMAKKIFTGLREKLTNIPIYKLMGAFPSFGRGIGVRKMKALYDAFEGDMSLCESYSKIVDVTGFEDKTATKVQNGYAPFVAFLSEIGNAVTIAPYEAPKSGKWDGIVVVFTEVRDKNCEAQIINQGGKIGSSVSGKTGLLVAKDPEGLSGKAKKARDLGIKIITLDELKELL